MEIIGETEKWKIEEFGVVISIQHEMIVVSISSGQSITHST